MENMEVKKEKDEKSGGYINALWSTFEKTGSVSAYLLYNVVRDKTQKGLKVKERNNTLQK